MADHDGFSSPAEDDGEVSIQDRPKPKRLEAFRLRERLSVARILPSKCPSNCCPIMASYSISEPKDHYNLVYVCMLMAGVGFLLPWSSYISAIDYFFFLYHSDFSTVSEAIPVTYLLTTLFFSTINIGLVNLFSIHTRIRFGYVMFTLSLIFIPLLDIGINNCTVSTHVSYYLTLMSIVAVGVGSGVQQSSYYGLSSMLPQKYSQAVMAGESVAGVVVSFARIITKLAIRTERLSAIIFFVISLLFVLFCFCCHIYIQCSPFVKHHVAKCREKKKAKDTNKEDSSVNKDELHQMNELHSVSETNGVSERKPSDPDEYEFSGFSDDDQVELIPVAEDSDTVSQKTWFKSFVDGLRIRWVIVKQIWKLMIAIYVNYFVTLLLFPGLVSEVQYCRIGDWTPIILIAVFNVTDFVAKWLALLPCSLRWPSLGLMLASISRFVLIPLLLICIVPSPSSPVIGGGAAVGVAVMFNFLLGVSNDFFGSLPMINVSREVRKDKDRELAGTIMVWVLLLALTIGSVLAYALTPLTHLADRVDCNSTITLTSICNRTMTS